MVLSRRCSEVDARPERVVRVEHVAGLLDSSALNLAVDETFILYPLSIEIETPTKGRRQQNGSLASSG